MKVRMEFESFALFPQSPRGDREAQYTLQWHRDVASYHRAIARFHEAEQDLVRVALDTAESMGIRNVQVTARAEGRHNAGRSHRHPEGLVSFETKIVARVEGDRDE